MTKYLIGAAAIALAGAAIAQEMRPPVVQTPQIGMQGQGTDTGGRIQTRAEVVAKAQKHFAMLDSNRDGAITAEEMQAIRGQRMGNRMARQGNDAMRDGPMANPGAMFDRLDGNHDGSISRDEFAKGREVRIERKIVMNGAPDGTGRGEHRMMKMHRMGGGGMRGAMVKLADTNSDGRITLQEMTAAALQRFDLADTNRDGQVTREERQAMHQQMMQQRGRTAG